ncbi:MAG: hypothetical protein WBH50_23645 [Fuerstiella sp.]
MADFLGAAFLADFLGAAFLADFFGAAFFGAAFLGAAFLADFFGAAFFLATDSSLNKKSTAGRLTAVTGLQKTKGKSNLKPKLFHHATKAMVMQIPVVTDVRLEVSCSANPSPRSIVVSQ